MAGSQHLGDVGTVGSVDTVTTIDTITRVASIGYTDASGIAVAKGDVAGSTYVHKFGQAPDFDTEDLDVDIWDGANDTAPDLMSHTYSTTADIDSLSSSDNSDTQDVEVQGLNSSWELVVQTITLTGRTRKALSTDLIRVFRMKNVGATDFAGTIYCFKNVALTAGVPQTLGNIRAMVTIGRNQTLMALYTVPSGKKAYLHSFYAGVAGAKKTASYEIILKIKPFGQVFQTKHVSAIADEGSSHLEHHYDAPEVVSAKSDIKITAHALTAGVEAASVSAGFDLLLVDD